MKYVNELIMIMLPQMFSVPPPCCENASCMTSIGSGMAVKHGAHAIDFKGEAMTFKATTAGVLDTLQHCLELLGQREDTWRRRLEREVERRRKVEELYQTVRQEAAPHRLALHGSPDYEVGGLLQFRSSFIAMCSLQAALSRSAMVTMQASRFIPYILESNPHSGFGDS
jgi:hypothetical protein